MAHYNKLLILDDQGRDNNFQMEMRVEFNYAPGTPATPDGDAGDPGELELLAVRVLRADSGKMEFYRPESDVMFKALKQHFETLDQQFMEKLEGSEVLWKLAEEAAA